MALKVEDLKSNFQSRISLPDIPEGSNGLIIEVPDLPLLASLGIRKGKILQCLGCQLFGGPMIVKVGDRQIALSRRVAKQILVKPL